MKRKILAVLLTAALVMSSEVPVFAIDNSGDVYSDGETHDVSGGDEGVGAVGEDTVVNVTGDVTGQAMAGAGNECYGGSAVAVDDGVVNITGNVGDGETDSIGVHAVGGEVSVNGDVSGVEDAIFAEDHATVNVEGNVTGSVVAEDSTVQITGNLQGTTRDEAGDEAGDPDAGGFAYPVINDFNSNIVVDGNVSSGTTAIETRGGSTIVITGTLTSGGSKPVIVFDHSMEVVTPADPTDPNSFPTTEPVNNPDATASTILVHEIKGDLQNLVKSGYTNSDYDFIEDTDSTLKNSQLDNIFYIIKKAADSVANILGLRGTQTKEGYDVAKAGTTFTATVKEGYGLTAGTIAVTKNADGTYTLIVPQGGGVTLTAEQIQEAVQEAEQQEQQPTQPAAQPEQQPEQSAAQPEQQPAAQPEQQPAAQPEQQPEQSAAQPEQQPEQSAAQPEQQPEQPAAVDWEKKEEEHRSSSSAQDQSAFWRSATISVREDMLDPVLDQEGFLSTFVDKIANAPWGGTAYISVKDQFYLDSTIIQALAARSDVTVRMSVFKANGEIYIITIPAGHDLSNLVNKSGKISMDTLIDKFGTRVS